MKKRKISFIVIVSMLVYFVSYGAVFAASEADYYARNFMATDNGVFWEGCAQISWFNPAEAPQKVSFYASGPVQTDGSYVLLGDSYDTTANASVVTTLPTKNWEVTPRNGWYNFKLVFEFAGGKSTEQMLDYYVPNDGSGNWSYETAVSDDFRTIAQRGGWCYGNPAGNNYDYFPMGSEVVYKDGNPALKIWSNGHILDGTNETRDGKTNNSGNYFGRLQLANNLASDTSKAYDISFRYQAKGIENLSLELNGAYQMSLQDTGGEWASFSQTNVPYTCPAYIGSLFSFLFKVGNEELIIDDVVVKETGTDINLVSDGDFSSLAAAAPADVSDAMMMYNDGNVFLTWTDSPDAQGVNVYKVENGAEIKKAFVKQTNQTISFSGAETDSYILKAIGSRGEESPGVICSAPAVQNDEIAVDELMASPSGKAGEIDISWRNSSYPVITNVQLEAMNGEILASSAEGELSTDPKALCTYKVTGVDNYSFSKYKVITQTDIGNITQVVTGVAVPLTDTGYFYEYPLTAQMNVKLMSPEVGGALANARVSIINENGNNAVKFINHITERTDSSWLELYVPYKNLDLKADTQYKLELRYKGSGYAWQKIYIHDQSRDLGGVDLFTNDTATRTSWTNFSKIFQTDSSNGTQGIRIMMEAPTNGPLWIDDIQLTEVSSGMVVFEEDFENHLASCEDVISDLSAEADDGAVKLRWTAPGVEDIPKIVRVFVQVNGSEYLAAKLSPFDTCFDVTELTNGETYTFKLDIVDMNGYSSDAVYINAMPIAAKYKVGEIVLTDTSGNPVTGNIRPGTYTASVDVKNNAMGSSFTAQLIICLYNGDTLYDAQCSPVTIIEQSNWKDDPALIVTSPVTVPDMGEQSFTFSIYVWDSIRGMTKLSETKHF